MILPLGTLKLTPSTAPNEPYSLVRLRTSSAGAPSKVSKSSSPVRWCRPATVHEPWREGGVACKIGCKGAHVDDHHCRRTSACRIGRRAADPGLHGDQCW